MAPPFRPFGPSHLAVIALAFLLPLPLAAMVRKGLVADRRVRLCLALLLLGGWLGWYLLFWARGWLGLGNALPLNLCDWATVALFLALLRPARGTYELGYFWGLGGTLQGLLTPDIRFGFPDPQFLLFSLNHAAILVALLYLTLGTGLRPVPASIARAVGATLCYAMLAGAADFLLGTNYGFLRAKPANASLIDLLSPWPCYIPELAGLGVLLALLCYAPFFILDAATGRTAPRPAARPPSAYGR